MPISATWFNCDRNAIPCISDEDCDITCNYNIERMSHYKCYNDFCVKQSSDLVEEEYVNQASKDLIALKKSLSLLTPNQSSYITTYPKDFIIKRAEFYKQLQSKYGNISNASANTTPPQKISFEDIKRRHLGLEGNHSDSQIYFTIRNDAKYRSDYNKKLSHSKIEKENFLCNEELGAGIELYRYTSDSDPTVEVGVCLCLHPKQYMGPACKWETRFDATDYEQSNYEPYSNSKKDYDKALAFCKSVSVNLWTRWDNDHKTFFCYPKAERLQESLTNNTSSNILTFMENRLLNESQINFNLQEHSLMSVLMG